ncbi:MAG TPA: SIS domain-containing protein [Acidimicrobiales bacterium]|nr:SIS domain-containing protein [Acidimicrobiales bacterium]
MAVLTRPSSRRPPEAAAIAASLESALGRLQALRGDGWAGGGVPAELPSLVSVAKGLVDLDASLRGVPGVTRLLSDPALVPALQEAAGQLENFVGWLEAAVDAGEVAVDPEHSEALNAVLVLLRDAAWALGHDRVDAAKSIAGLAEALSPWKQGSPSPPATPTLAVLWAVHVALRSLDRLEVRGRDSAGLHLMLAGHGLELSSPEVQALLAARVGDRLFGSFAVRAEEGCLSFVYKAAAEIGELGDNVAALRGALQSDPLLAMALASPEVRATVVGHTRWASVGLISQANAHPLNSEGSEGTRGPYVIGALNGDIDNHAELVVSQGLHFPDEVTTDAKLVPTLVSAYMAGGGTAAEAFRAVVNRFEGSMGIVVNAAQCPDEVYLALRGSGQSLNVGLAEDAFVVASEAYGLVEEAGRYVAMRGEGTGEIVVCSRSGAGTLDGISRRRYDGAGSPLSERDVTPAEITTRDIDRDGFQHFLLKEISESPGSVRKTLRGKLTVQANGDLGVRLGDDVIPRTLRSALASGLVHEIAVVGQGTAAVAGQAVAAGISSALPNLAVKAMPATELSGWGFSGSGLADDMSGTLVVAISQSGTTTDTNRTVDLARARGAHVVAIVNRRNSDLVRKAHGVLYTSDGRDVEMSVASTKAFYSQVAAGHLLALALAEAAGTANPERTRQILAALRGLPASMEEVVARRAEIAAIAGALAPSRRNWAVVGSGPDRIAAAEVRIKLSELCYKAIAFDSIEDKKHIDLSAEPMVIVCAGGASGPNARDIAKEVQIFRAHKAAPVLIIAEGEKARFGAGADVIEVPSCHPELSYVLTAMAGHIFGYESALAIDAQARPLREARVLLEGAVVANGAALSLEPLGPTLQAVTAPALAGLRSGAYDGHLDASVAARLSTLLRYATGALPIEGYEAEMGKAGTPGAIAGDLVAALGAAIDELTRPIDAIKHQAKTVTVGISRSEDALLRSPMVAQTLAAGAPLESLGYRALRTLAALGGAVEEVLGYTRYRIDLAQAGTLEGATVGVIDKRGVAEGIHSRTATDPTLRGTKHRAAEKREVTVFKGLHDGRTGVMVPEVKDAQPTGITLLHARFASFLPAQEAKTVLNSYQGRYTALVDAVTELQPSFDDEVLGTVPVIELLTEPVAVLARHWAKR